MVTMMITFSQLSSRDSRDNNCFSYIRSPRVQRALDVADSGEFSCECQRGKTTVNCKQRQLRSPNVILAMPDNLLPPPCPAQLGSERVVDQRLAGRCIAGLEIRHAQMEIPDWRRLRICRKFEVTEHPAVRALAVAARTFCSANFGMNLAHFQSRRRPPAPKWPQGPRGCAFPSRWKLQTHFETQLLS
jgi:hypothetical protein